MAAQMSRWLAARVSSHVKSTTETSEVGTRKDIPVSLPFSAGSTLVTASAAPVDAGMMFSRMPRPKRQSLPDVPSTTFCVAVVAWTVVIRPRLMPKESSRTLASGARQLVVQDAAETIGWPAYRSVLTPYTKIGVSSFEGADM